MNKDRLFQVDTGYACFGLVARDGRVVEAAPIAGWSLGKPLQDVFLYFLKKGATIREVES